ncbi:hypothetical protein SAMN05443639_105241 [Stigmatella erecta]|uniref:Triacylglycerol esterase/lipase EstA, alpha/beta hydrolase fold n=2 Tax=Stigmatella erecta TaxID=83460 RepID=A0A1I0I1F8_9BACT|nr:hypothetical protein SAMN05443639_105241 [Stigmatella erecta]
MWGLAGTLFPMATPPRSALPAPGPLPALLPPPGAVARLVRSLRGLPPAQDWWGPGCAGLPGWFHAESAPTTEATPRFRELYARVRRGERVLPAGADRHLYLFVRGMLGDELFGYLEANQVRLERRGLETHTVSVDTEAPLEANLAQVRKALEDAAFFGRSVVLVGHSKGAVESLSALSLYPHLRAHVRAVLALQAPYGGSPVAHDLMASPEMRRVVDIALPLLFYGVSRCVEDLSYPARMDFVRRHPYPVDIPTVSLATSRDSRRSLLWPVAHYLRQRYGLASDGLVATVDAEIPGSRVVRLEDLDHAQAAMLGIPGLTPYHPGDLTEALVALALE